MDLWAELISDFDTFETAREIAAAVDATVDKEHCGVLDSCLEVRPLVREELRHYREENNPEMRHSAWQKIEELSIAIYFSLYWPISRQDPERKLLATLFRHGRWVG